MMKVCDISGFLQSSVCVQGMNQQIFIVQLLQFQIYVMYWENAEKDTDPIELYNPVVKRKLGIHNDDKQAIYEIYN